MSCLWCKEERERMMKSRTAIRETHTILHKLLLVCIQFSWIINSLLFIIFPFSNEHTSSVSRMFVFTHFGIRQRREKGNLTFSNAAAYWLYPSRKYFYKCWKQRQVQQINEFWCSPSGFQLEKANEKSTSCLIHWAFLFMLVLLEMKDKLYPTVLLFENLLGKFRHHNSLSFLKKCSAR